MKLILFLSFALTAVFVNGQFSDEFLSQVMLNADQTNEELLKMPQGRSSKAYTCPRTCTVSGPKPTSVHDLRPGDIEVVAAIGDSLTAGNGATASTILGLLTEDRGFTWNMGVQKDITSQFSLANQIKFCNPNVVGGSTGAGKNTSPQAGLNIANPGDTSHEMMGQAQELVKRIRGQGHENKWKLLTFFIGGNDLCKYCKDRNKYTVNNYITNIENTLDYLKANLPKTFVNLVLTLDTTGILPLNGTTCRNMQKTLCNCALDNPGEITAIAKTYQERVENLIYGGKYDDTDDYTVALQTFMKFMTPPLVNNKPDYTLFAPDCFHFSAKGHELAGHELWNAIISPNHHKIDKWEMKGPICPTQNTRLHTNVSSRKLLLNKK